MHTLTRKERLDIIHQANIARKNGDIEKALKLSKQIPLAPHLAKFYLEEFGKEKLLNAGFNLSAAEEKYGKNWLAE